MINVEELLFIVDENNRPLKPQKRSIAHKNLLWHRTSGVWVTNSGKKVLCQKRSLKKDIKPGMWEAFFGGHLAPNKNYQENAVNEVSEELGVKVSKARLKMYKVFKSDKPTHKEFQQIFALKIDEDVKNFNFERDEIDELKWVDIEESRKILLEGKDSNWVHKPWDEDVLNWLTTLKF